MVDPRVTGAVISRLRRAIDWTQLELAEQLHVTHQAVSRWETGESFPDVVILYSIAQLFGVRVDELLDSSPSPSPIGRSRLTTGDVLTELAQGHPEEVARMVHEGEVD